MQDLLIFGSGVHALEMAEFIEQIDNREYRLCGFVSKDSNVKELMGYPVYGIEDLEGDFSHAALVPDNTFELELKQKYLDRMISLVDPSCFVSRTASIGRGCVIYPSCFVGHNAVIEDFVFCLSGSVINHDDIIGTGSILASGVRIAGNVNVERQVYLGQACTIRQLLNIGEGSIIGTGAVVIKDVEPYSVMVGNPARLLRKCSVKE